MGGLGGGAAGAGGAGAAGGLELPQIGASMKTAASNHREDKKKIDVLRSLPVWGKKAVFMGVSYDTAELAARRLLDSIGQGLSKTVTQGELRRILSTGNTKRDQVLRYLMTRVGIIRNADITKSVAIDIHKELESIIQNPRLLISEMNAVVACVNAGRNKDVDYDSAKNDEHRSKFFKQADNSSISSSLRGVISGEKRHVKSNQLLTGFVPDTKIFEEE